MLWSAVALTAILALVALGDQLGGRSLEDHAVGIYAPKGKTLDPALLYGLVYVVAVVNGLLWWLVVRSARIGSRWAPALTATVATTTATLSVAMLVASEYGERIYPPLWGGLALLAPIMGGIALVPMVRRSP